LSRLAIDDAGSLRTVEASCPAWIDHVLKRHRSKTTLRALLVNERRSIVEALDDRGPITLMLKRCQAGKVLLQPRLLLKLLSERRPLPSQKLGDASTYTGVNSTDIDR
jgi:hypothetical protein